MTRSTSIFQGYKSKWWQSGSKESKMLHLINRARMQFVDKNFHTNCQKTTLLDIGCGGGIFAECLTKKGFSVTGVDTIADSIVDATNHAKKNNLIIQYHTCEIEKMQSRQYDVIAIMDVLEHVENWQDFLSQVITKFQPKQIIISTIAKNIKSFILAKFMAEYVLMVVPPETHSFAKFINLLDVQTFLTSNKFQLTDKNGIFFNPITNKTSLIGRIDVNYISLFSKT